MRILDIREKTVSISSDIRNAYIDFSKMDVSVVAVVTDVMRDGKPVIVRLPEIDFIDDKVGKPIGINSHIGRRPIASFGNSDGDLQMLQWTAAGAGRRFCLLVHHTDADREWAYDRESHVGRLDKALDEAKTRSWTVVDMKKNWNVIYPFQRKHR